MVQGVVERWNTDTHTLDYRSLAVEGRGSIVTSLGGDDVRVRLWTGQRVVPEVHGGMMEWRTVDCVRAVVASDAVMLWCDGVWLLAEG